MNYAPGRHSGRALHTSGSKAQLEVSQPDKPIDASTATRVLQAFLFEQVGYSDELAGYAESDAGFFWHR